ncbi:hypothetical protein K502DRAFT_194600 [Neoconidiobolus thromboides FSU 785]|nr:hypothetical protein K502DRAFT_194600 [Neoconidiobolus thromboides FSU 785]
MAKNLDIRPRLLKSHINLLETLYNENPRPGLKIRKQLALRMGIEQRKVQIWFQNRRAKEVREAQSTTASLNHLNSEATNHGSPDCSSVNSEGLSPMDTQTNNFKEHTTTRILSHYWASTMNSCKMLQF